MKSAENTDKEQTEKKGKKEDWRTILEAREDVDLIGGNGLQFQTSRRKEDQGTLSGAESF